MDHVRPVDLPDTSEITSEGRDVRKEIVLGNGTGRSRVDVVDDDTRRELHASGQRRIVSPGVHDDLVAERPQVAGEVRDVHVLASGIDTAEQRERAGVL
jgi:2-keto-3-deoxy-6-phosphogluconate aldolase